MSGEHLAMLADASVARSFAVIGWTRQLLEVCAGTITVADGVHGRHPDAIAARRSLAFASDDEDALILWTALTGSPGQRTRDLLWRLVSNGTTEEDDARDAYHLLQTDDLHNLGGPPW